MSTEDLLQRRDVITGLAGLGAWVASTAASAQSATPADHSGHTMAMPPPAPLSPEHRTVIATTADCQRAGRVCLARCTEHLAAGMQGMADCQRAVMNMLAVVSAMADVAGFANTSPANLKSLAATCAAYCASCADACEPHAGHHEECHACREACLACAKACRALAA